MQEQDRPALAGATSARTSDSAPFISRLQQLHAGLYAGPLRDALGPGAQVRQVSGKTEVANHHLQTFRADRASSRYPEAKARLQ
jgi:hypothetical protein